MSKKYITLALVLSMLISLVLIPGKALATGSGNNPPSNGYGTWYIDEGLGTFPATLDPANCYDSTSAECIFNSVETLIFFMGENPDKFEALLATQATVAPPDPAAPIYTNFTVYFKIRGTDPATGAGTVPFQNRCRTDTPVTWGNFYLTTKDVEFSFERFLIHDYVGAATWMFYEFLLDCHVADPYGIGPAWGTLIAEAVQSNNTHVWLNIANPGRTPRTSTPTFTPVNMFIPTVVEGATWPTFDPNFYTNCQNLPIDYPLRILFQVVAQPWCSIMSKQWVQNYVNTNLPPHAGAALADWPGTTYADWHDYTGWDSSDSPLDKLPIAAPTPGVMCGTGPYILDTYDAATGWSSVAYDIYWGGWPEAYWYTDRPGDESGPSYGRLYPLIPYANSLGISPSDINQEGRVTRLTVINTRNTAGRIADFISGAVDNADISRADAYKVHYPGTSNADRNGPTQDGIRLNYPIPTLQVCSQHYTFIVDPTVNNTYGIINNNDTLSSNGIPANFFNNTHVRLAFTYLWNYTYSIQTLFFGEAYQPHTCAPDGLPYVNLANPMYGDSPTDEAKAKAELDLAVFAGTFLNTVGFTVDLCYYDAGGGVMEASVLDLEASINKLGTDYGLPYHATHSNIPWNDFIPAINAHLCATFRVGWLADYVDIQDFLFPYGASQGDFGKAQRIGAYGGITAQIDAYLKEAAREPDGPSRQALYYAAEALLYTLNPTVFILVQIERGYQRTWDQGFALEHNALMPGIYAYWLWKWIDYRGDVDYNGKVNMGDVVYILDAFGSYIGKNGMPVIHPRWNYHCDIDGNPLDSGPLGGDGGWRDRKIDMYDVSAALADFGKATPGIAVGAQSYNTVWEIYIKVTPVSGAHPRLLTATAIGGNPAAYTYQWYQCITGLGYVLIPGATASTYNAAAAGAFACEVRDGVQISMSFNNATLT